MALTKRRINMLLTLPGWEQYCGLPETKAPAAAELELAKMDVRQLIRQINRRLRPLGQKLKTKRSSIDFGPYYIVNDQIVVVRYEIFDLSGLLAELDKDPSINESITRRNARAADENNILVHYKLRRRAS